MQLYNPGPYEEFIGELSSITVRPNADSWKNICKRLDQIDARRRHNTLKKYSVAATIILLFALGIISLTLTQNLNTASQITENTPTKLIPNTSIADKQNQNPQNDNQTIIPATIIESKTEERIEILEVSNIETKSSQLPKIKINETTEDLPKPPQLAFSDESHQPLNEFDSDKRLDHPKQTDYYTQGNKYDLNINYDDNGSWSIVAFINPTYSNQIPSLSMTPNPANTKIWGWGGEILVRRKFNNFLSLYSGLQINPLGKDISHLFNPFTPSNDGIDVNSKLQVEDYFHHDELISSLPQHDLSKSENTKYSKAYHDNDLLQQLFFMEIPLIISASFTKGSVDFEVKLGSAAGILVDNRLAYEFSDGSLVHRTESIRRFNASALGAINLSVPVNNNLRLMVEPNLRFNLNPLETSYTTMYPITASIKFGMGYRF